VRIALIAAIVSRYAILNLLQRGNAEVWMTNLPLSQMAGINAPSGFWVWAPNDT
jgi:hypothetical protein